MDELPQKRVTDCYTAYYKDADHFGPSLDLVYIVSLEMPDAYSWELYRFRLYHVRDSGFRDEGFSASRTP